MQGFGIKGLVTALIAGLWLISSGCKDDPKTVCCKCTCRNDNWTIPERDFYTSGENIDCKRSCLTKCTVEENYLQVKAASSVSCDEADSDT